MNIFPFKSNSSVQILLRPIALLFVVAGIMVLSACKEDHCEDLQEFYDNCCNFCGENDSYCGSYGTVYLSEEGCRVALDEESADGCFCD